MCDITFNTHVAIEGNFQVNPSVIHLNTLHASLVNSFAIYLGKDDETFWKILKISCGIFPVKFLRAVCEIGSQIVIKLGTIIGADFYYIYA